ncbi:hypothetical protein B296_00019455 [Ensete ventricosum]|uniref:Uncharacterized protein n=1 Tax=Ensete ventricosum TaxID=4639 RepID=A0A426YJK7_ENSVE|nr:hypothetical protein B296_00019455 [Ensete ventricosum]
MLDHEPARERHTLRIEDRRFDRPGRRRGGTRSALPLMGRGVVLDDAVVVVQPLGVTRQTSIGCQDTGALPLGHLLLDANGIETAGRTLIPRGSLLTSSAH